MDFWSTTGNTRTAIQNLRSACAGRQAAYRDHMKDQAAILSEWLVGGCRTKLTSSCGAHVQS